MHSTASRLRYQGWGEMSVTLFYVTAGTNFKLLIKHFNIHEIFCLLYVIYSETLA